MTVEPLDSRITRRGFLELSSAALTTVGLKGVADTAECSPNPHSAAEMAKPDLASTTGKIALEEHFGLPESANYAGKDLPTEEDRANFFDLGSRRIADMDRGGARNLHTVAGRTWGTSCQTLPKLSS
jgi:hypothetical protein